VAISDAELANLIVRCSDKDQSALERIYLENGPFLNAVAFQIVQSDYLSNEVLKEGFVHIWEHAASYQFKTIRPQTWLCSVIRCKASKKIEETQDTNAERLLAKSADSINTLLANQRVTTLFAQACEQQRNREQRCIELAYLRGYSRKELAQHFDTTVNIIKGWLHQNALGIRQ